MAESKHYQRGDVVVHARRPDWGPGVVKETTMIMHRAKSAQRLTIEFANKGRVVVNTAVAPLTPKGPDYQQKSQSTMIDQTATTPSPEGGWLASLQQSRSDLSKELWELPKSMTDPFASVAGRIEATLDSFQFSTEPRSLIDWAVAQTRLGDPMTKYTRQELEQAFERFAWARDQHLRGLVRQIKRDGDAPVLAKLARRIGNAKARTALNKAIQNL